MIIGRDIGDKHIGRRIRSLHGGRLCWQLNYAILVVPSS
jgi:hypothetical protein